MSNYEKRIAEIVGTTGDSDTSEENLLKFREHLLKHFDRTKILTGREDFLWEERYVLGAGDPDEYAELKRDNPSYTDRYELVDILLDETLENDLMAKVKRLVDGKYFELGLSWLTTEIKGKDRQLLDDFATWTVN